MIRFMVWTIRSVGCLAVAFHSVTLGIACDGMINNQSVGMHLFGLEGSSIPDLFPFVVVSVVGILGTTFVCVAFDEKYKSRSR